MATVIQSDEEIPTVLALDAAQGEFILGAQAKEQQLKGRTGLIHFKKLAGQLSSQIQKASALWYLDLEGKPQTLSLTETLNHYFRLLDSGGDVQRSYFVGVPAGLENQAWIDRYKTKVTECLKACGPLEVHFVDEPSAVFEYYRSQGKLRPEARFCLVLDVGGSTFNCALVEQRGESRDAKVHYAASEFFGGTDIDQRLFIEAAKEAGFGNNIEGSFFDSQATGMYVLKSRLEEIKIHLSNPAVDHDEIRELELPEGLLPAGEEVVLVTREHLNKSVDFAWDSRWRQLVNEVIARYQNNSKNDDLRIDAILMAGGSSRLPDMKAWAERVLTHYVSSKTRTPRVKNQERAVAHGMKALCEKHAEAQRGSLVSGLQRFFTGDLYLAFRNHHADVWECPVVNGKRNNGLVFGGGASSEYSTFSADIELPFKVSENFLMGVFSDNPMVNPDSQINIGDEACRNAGSGFLKKANLDLAIDENNQVKVTLWLRKKKKNLDPREFSKGPYAVDGINLIEGIQYVGLDFGHSNTYLTKIILKSEEEDGQFIPNFRMRRAGRSALERLHKKIEKLRTQGLLDEQRILQYAASQIDEICYQSSKLEREKVAPPEELAEVSSASDTAARLRDTYLAVLDSTDDFLHYTNLTYSIQAYLCQLHKKFGDGWIRDAGQFRTLNMSPSINLKTPDGAILGEVMQDISSDYMGGKQRSTDPIWAAVKYHVAFEMAHPFFDGNGRTGRLMLDVMCLNAGLPPVIISADRRADYIAALEDAGTGDATDLVLLIARHLDQRLDEIARIDAGGDTGELGSEYDASVIEMLDQFNRGEDPLEAILNARQQLEADVLETAYVTVMEGFSRFDSVVDELVERIGYRNEGSMFPARFEIIPRDSLTEDSYKRFRGGHREIEFNYKTLIFESKSGLTGRHEARKFHFYCIGEKGDASLRLRLMFEGSNDEGLVFPADTHVALREILLSEEKNPAVISTGDQVDLNKGMSMFFVGVFKDSERAA